MSIDFEIVADYYKISVDDCKYLCRKTSPICKCGQYKLLKNSKQSKIGCYFYRCCGDTKCEPNTGLSRPEHSKKMKLLVSSGSQKFKDTLMKPGCLFNQEVNGLNFKKKRLQRHGIEINGLSPSCIEKEYSLLLSKFNTSISRKKLDILNRYIRWEDEFKQLILIVTNGAVPNRNWINDLDESELKYYWTRIHGINTIRNWTRVKQTRNTWFKSEFISGFKYNTKNQTEIFVKSGLEKKYVEFFERNKIYWEYETLFLENTDKSGFHVPDFLVELDGTKCILELKGSFYRQPFEEYYSKKILSAINYAKNNNWNYILTQKNPDMRYTFITKSLINLKGDIGVKN